MSKNGKLKKAQNVEKRRIQMQEAMECLPLKQVAEEESVVVLVPKKQPKQCAFQHCQRYIDPSCTICPYCGKPL
jgi:hypothetical protein